MNMDMCQNVSVSSECQQEQILAPSCSSSLDDLFSAQNTEVDVELEWLSVFVEDCFSSPPSCVLVPASVQTTSSNPSGTLKRPQQNESPLQNFAVPGKARSKRKRLSAPRTKDPLSIWSHHLNPQNEALSSDPPLLKQAYWLADSELIMPKPKEEQEVTKEDAQLVEKGIVIVSKESFEDSDLEGGNGQHPMPRRCTHCLAQRTPQWRAGPLGPKTLCNACGVRYKSGRLLPEYRPAKSPTFVSYLHSNSHKKVMEMRMAVYSSISSDQNKLFGNRDTIKGSDNNDVNFVPLGIAYMGNSFLKKFLSLRSSSPLYYILSSLEEKHQT
ncbi:GATA transcription factor 9, partial [Mucuna pruriens]